MADEQIITIKYPKKYVAPEDTSGFEILRMPWRPGWSMSTYYAETRGTAKLGPLSQKKAVRKMPSRERVFLWYVPKPGEEFWFCGINESYTPHA